MKTKNPATWIAIASGGNPIISVISTMLLYIGINAILAAIEELMFGERFLHWGDPVIMSGFWMLSCATIWKCGLIQIEKMRRS